MSYNSHITEECPLTREKSYKYRLCVYCGNGLNFIIVCFVALTFAITTMLVLQILYTENIPQNSLHGIHGAVATDYSNCSQIGTRILRKLGNAVDAAIAATICMTVVAPHKTGLGGGGYIMIYNSKSDIHPVVIDFANNADKGFFAKAGIRLPALLKGLEFAHIIYGNLPWHDIVEPSAKLAREGFVVSKDLVDEVSRNTDYGTHYNGPLNPGDILQLHELANTLDMVAEYGVKVFYNGNLSNKILHSSSNLHEDSLQELASYMPTLTIAQSSTLHHHTIYYPPRMSLMQTVIETLESLPILMGNASTIESLTLVAETLMHIYSSSHVQHGERGAFTGVMAMDWQETYVCILSGLSSPLGPGNMTDAGFLLDNVDDNDLFTFIPIIFHYEKGICGLRGVFGSDDVFLNGQILYNLIVRALNVSAAIEYPRYYFAPDGIMIENNQRHSIDTALQARLYPMILSLPIFDDNLLIKSINAIIKKKDSLSSHSDSRGNGIASRF
ncbi:glutathione hydrolase 7-like [Camponotus floridanus]|uniref:glutathione hydrolase 7-like n=1 Tax=Camponotus floridanus TaxID=104421 RepID=UPI000DC6BE5D|nr:glutathione hydrolase 7-like [Camponotus floridanus]